MSKNRSIHETLFFVMRTTLEWLFVVNLVIDVKLEMHAQVEQVLIYYMKRYVQLVENEDAGVTFNYDKSPLAKRKRESDN